MTHVPLSARCRQGVAAGDGGSGAVGGAATPTGSGGGCGGGDGAHTV